MPTRYPGHNQLDRTLLKLEPRDYAIDRLRFGHLPGLEFRVPSGGNVESLRAARTQHLLVVQFRQRRPMTGAALARRCGCSRQSVSRTLLGERWAGTIVQAGLIDALVR